MARWVMVGMVVSALFSCGSPSSEGCLTRADCDGAELCINGECTLPPQIDASLPDIPVVMDASDARDSGPDDVCGQECETELLCEIGVYDCSTGQAVCVRSGLKEAGAVCRPSADPCDATDVCDGVSAGCADAKSPIGSQCDGGFCDGRGTCGECDQGAACTPAPCQTGVTTCSVAGVPSCEMSGNVEDGTACGETIIGGFGACEWADTCAESGEQVREIQESVCTAGACVMQTRNETMPCARDQEDVMCGDSTMGTWSMCDYGNACDEDAERTRTITDMRCRNAACAGVPRTETEDCSRDTDGTMCGSPSTVWSRTCDFTTECVIDGTESGTVTQPTCVAGACDAMSSMTSRACSREDTMGDPCGSPVFGPWGTCLFFSCDPNDGTRYRQVTSACTTAQVCDPAGMGFELGTCTGNVVGSFCMHPSGSFATCTAPGTCTPGSPI